LSERTSEDAVSYAGARATDPAERDRLHDAFVAGHAASENELPIAEVPERLSPAERAAWIAGWQRALGARSRGPS
jgi:hypothetical protein